MAELRPQGSELRPERMIRRGEVAPARWHLRFELPEGYAPVEGEAIPFYDWLELKNAGQDVSGVGVICCGDQCIDDLEPHLASIPVVALYFPKFADGRVYSHARRLRKLWGFEGDILAFGDVLRDQLVYQWRVGFDAWYMREDQDLHGSLEAFRLFTDFYQYN